MGTLVASAIRGLIKQKRPWINANHAMPLESRKLTIVQDKSELQVSSVEPS